MPLDEVMPIATQIAEALERYQPTWRFANARPKPDFR